MDFVRAFIANAAAIPRPKIKIWGRYFVGRPERFFSKVISILVFLSEYGGYRPLQKKQSGKFQVAF